MESPLIKGLFIKVPLTAPQLNNVRRWYKTEKQDAVESLEKYSLQNAVNMNTFTIDGFRLRCSGIDPVRRRHLSVNSYTSFALNFPRAQ